MRRAIANVFLTMLVAACAGAAPEAQPDDEETPVQESSVAVRLVDFVVEPTPDSVPTGRVTFSVTNDGYATDEKGDHIPSISAGRHELSVLRTDLPAEELPENTLEFVVEVEAPGIEVIGSTPVLEEGATESLTLDLEPGPYVLICNLTSHYARGMWAEFSVRS
jgi:uncharacterized cupredoxin-like copper-binding protein